MAFQETQIAQGEIANSATSVFSPGVVGTTYVIKQVVICNHESSSSTFGIWLDEDGTTYDDTTVLFEDIPIEANSTVILDVFWPMNDRNGNLAAKAAAASTLTITIFGAEVI